ncbi:MAG TPA: uroporphyrinogen-III synthase [Gammaproteobacteria bacterium]|nr:uroporphyrinogen-III synthase [Gammaproteobacteria bacterium]
MSRSVGRTRPEDKTRSDETRLTVLLTRSEDDCAAWAEQLERRGIASVSLPCIAAEPIDTPELRRELEAAVCAADWIAFTSRRGVEAFARLLETGSSAALPRNRAKRHGADRQAAPRIAAVWGATAEAAKRVLGRVDLAGEAGTAESLARALVARLRAPADVGAEDERSDARPPRVLLAVAANARDALERELRQAGAECRRVEVYRTVPAKPSAPKAPLASLGVDAVLLASPSAVRGFANRVEIDGSAALVTIGPTTSAAVRALGLDVAGEAREPTLDALLDAVLEATPRSCAREGSPGPDRPSAKASNTDPVHRANPRGDDGQTTLSVNDQTETPHA